MLSPRNQLASGAENPCLARLGHRRRHVSFHRLAQEQLAVARALEELLGLRPGLVLVEPDDLAKVAELHAHRDALREVDEVVVEEWQPRLQAVGHRQLVLDDQQPVQERPCLEIQRVVDVILGPRRTRSDGE